MQQTRKSVTIQDVAEAAGVSVSTVSRVLNDKDDVAAETYEKVQQVVHELGYVSSLAARGMRSRRTNVIGLIMPDVASPYSIEVLQGVNRAIAQLDYDLIVYTNGDVRKNASAYQESYFVSLLNGNVTDGVIVVTPAATNFSTTAPVVAIDPNNESPECPAIISTNLEGALQVMEYLIGLGHRRIGFITGRLELVSANLRLQGYKEGLAQVGIPYDETLIQVGDYTTETSLLCTRALLALENPPTAIFASNDMSAMGVYQAAEEMGKRIPRDLSVVGFDNLRESAFLDPKLTTIDQSIPEMGYIATELIVKLIKGENLDSILFHIPTKLVIRDSCRDME
ncbi:MAG: LacI family DNA-binding transcriptional regulator [Anaerolineales bacterium]|nr:LacI family DNA-binding transcriptional regulator [Anaerolineales bacterium]